MFKFGVRPAGFGDFPAIYNLNVKILGSTLEREVMECAYRNVLTDTEQIVFAVIHSGRIAGYIHARQVNNLYEEAYTEVVGYAVYDYYRSNGADRALLTVLEKWCVQMLSNKIIVRLGAENPQTGNCLIENGFREKNSVSYEKNIF